VSKAIALTALVWLLGVVAPARAQNVGDPNNARVHVGPLALSPTIRLTNFGRDSNIYNDSKDNSPRGDLTATVSPVVEAWLRSPRVRVNGRGQFDFFYFKELSNLRALDTDTFARVELPLNRLTPYVEGNLANTRHRQNLEIDAIAKRRNDGVQVGTDVRLTAKASVRLYTGRSHIEYQPNSLYRETDLARSLNHTGSFEGLGFRYAATPLTTFAMNVEQGRDRFEFSSERNSDSFRVTPSVEFKPLALISGRAAVGFRRLRFREGDVPEFKGVVALVDLQYAFRGRTQFSIGASRDLEYSYIYSNYVLAGFNSSVTQRLGDAWDVRGTGGRYRLTFRQGPQGIAGARALPSETFLHFGLDVGYYIGRTRTGFSVQHYGRESDVSLGRGYERLRIGSSLTYVF